MVEWFKKLAMLMIQTVRQILDLISQQYHTIITHQISTMFYLTCMG